MGPHAPLSPQPPLPGPSTALGKVWLLLRLTGEDFIEDDDWSQGAAIAYFTLFLLAPALLVVSAVAGLVFGQDAAQGAIVGQLSGLMGQQTAEALEAMIRSASDRLSGTVAAVVGVCRPSDRLSGTVAAVVGLGAILLAISGVFGEVQSALNAVWKVKSRQSTLSRLARGRLISLGLIIAFGFVLMLSLAVSAALVALSTFMQGAFPSMEAVLAVVDFLLSIVLLGALFAAMYKGLPDTSTAWRDGA